MVNKRNPKEHLDEMQVQTRNKVGQMFFHALLFTNDRFRSPRLYSVGCNSNKCIYNNSIMHGLLLD